VRRGLAKRFCSDRCRKAFSRVVAGDFSASTSASTDSSIPRNSGNNHHTFARLPPKLRAAFARYRPDPNQKRPFYSRDVRIGIEYSLRVTVGDIKTDSEADAFAGLCIALGTLDQADVERGDPPATGAAMKTAERAGPGHARAFTLLNSIRDCSHCWAEDGRSYPALPEAKMRILQRAARGERVPQAELDDVLELAEELSRLLTHPFLERLPS
jgi:hypothetical protein